MLVNRVIMVILALMLLGIPLCGAADLQVSEKKKSIDSVGYLQVRSNQEGARVYCDGMYMGYVEKGKLDIPVDLNARPIWKDLILEYTDIQTYVGPIPSLVAGKTVAVDITMNKVGYGKMGIVEYKSIPPGAEIIIGNRSYGTSPDSGVLSLHTIPEGLYQFMVKKPGNLTEVSQQMVNANALLNYEVILKPATTGDIQISSSPQGAGIYIDNKYEGLTPLLVRDIPVGEHTLRIALEGYQDWTGDIRIIGTEQEPVDVVLVSVPPTPDCSPVTSVQPQAPSQQTPSIPPLMIYAILGGIIGLVVIGGVYYLKTRKEG